MIKPFLTKWPFLLKLRLFFILLGLIIVLVFLYLKVVPGGQITYTCDYDSWLKSGKGFIYGFTPAERVDTKSAALPRLIGDPVYFSLFTPRTFDQATVTVKYRDHLPAETPIVETGVLVDKLVWRYDLKPFENKILDRLKFKWDRLEDGARIILQSENNYADLADFENDLEKGQLKNCPGGPQTCLIVYNYQLDTDYHLTNYQAGMSLTIASPLRGAQQFFLYLNNEPLRISFDFVDLNQNKDSDPITIILSAGAKTIQSQTLADNTPPTTDGRLEIKSFILEEKETVRGVYKVEIKANEDIVTKKIVSSVNKLVFINKLWPVSTDGDLTFYTDANYLQVKALKPTSLQTLKFGQENFAVTEIDNQFTFKTNSGALLKEIKLTKDDLILENNGVFAFSPESFFDPLLKKLDRYFTPNGGTQYLIANYKSPQGDENLKTATAEFNLRGAYREKGKYSFMISIPGLRAEDGTDDYWEIKEIKIELKGRTLWQKIFN
jgi:hypothetical protein